MLNTSEKSSFIVTTSKMSWSAGGTTNASNSGLPIVPAPTVSTKASNITVDNTTTFLLDGVYFEPSRNHKLQYFDREQGVFFKWIQVCMQCIGERLVGVIKAFGWSRLNSTVPKPWSRSSCSSMLSPVATLRLGRRGWDTLTSPLLGSLLRHGNIYSDMSLMMDSQFLLKFELTKS